MKLSFLFYGCCLLEYQMPILQHDRAFLLLLQLGLLLEPQVLDL